MLKFIINVLIKKLIKLVLVGVGIFTIYLGYLQYSGKEAPTILDELKEMFQGKLEEVDEMIDKKSKKIIPSSRKGLQN